MTTIIVIILIIFSVHLCRQHWATKDLTQIYFGSFDSDQGELYTIEDTVIAIQHAKNEPAITVICFPGFTEDARYFQEAYKGSTHEIIFMGNAGYHSPFSLDKAKQLDWAVNPFAMGTIEYDGFWVGQTMQNLATSKNIVIHGHSRGGAVALETGRQFPQLTKTSVSLILEAAVVPRGTIADPLAGKVAQVTFPYLLPLVFAMLRNITVSKMAKLPLMTPHNSLKAKLIVSTFSTAKKYQTFVTNSENIRQWQENTAYNVYGNFKKVTALIGERDDVLNCQTMIASVNEGMKIDDGVSLVQTKNTNHFITLEEPHCIHDAIG